MSQIRHFFLLHPTVFVFVFSLPAVEVPVGSNTWLASISSDSSVRSFAVLLSHIFRDARKARCSNRRSQAGIRYLSVRDLTSYLIGPAAPPESRCTAAQ